MERAVMAATDEILSLNRVEVEDETFNALQQQLSDPEILELFVVSGTWRMHGLIVRALHLEYDNDTTAHLKAIPAPATKE
jgi:alkylhydroperoxidase family enzyme